MINLLWPNCRSLPVRLLVWFLTASTQRPIYPNEYDTPPFFYGRQFKVWRKCDYAYGASNIYYTRAIRCDCSHEIQDGEGEKSHRNAVLCCIWWVCFGAVTRACESEPGQDLWKQTTAPPVYGWPVVRSGIASGHPPVLIMSTGAWLPCPSDEEKHSHVSRFSHTIILNCFIL